MKCLKMPICCWYIFWFLIYAGVIALLVRFNIGTARQISGWEMTFLTTISVFPTIAIAIIAYQQLTKIVKTNVDEALLNLDSQWRSPEIIEARIIIDEIFQRYYRINESTKGNYDHAMSHVSDEIFHLSRPSTQEELINNQSNFIYILSLIELLETIGLLYTRADENIKNQIKALMKDSVTFYYKACETYINNAMKKSENRFSSFKDLYELIENSD